MCIRTAYIPVYSSERQRDESIVQRIIMQSRDGFISYSVSYVHQDGPDACAQAARHVPEARVRARDAAPAHQPGRER